METIPHPAAETLQLSQVMAALSDPLRLAIVRRLAAEGEVGCGNLGDATYKTKLSYHLKILREAGVTRTRADGTARLVKLRREELDGRFPGLIDLVLKAEPEPSDLLPIE
jgi:DNA-binding transcriptional ArsR family regulator